jgi:hypothetical protein
MVKPKPMSDSDVRFQAISVRSALRLVRIQAKCVWMLKGSGAASAVAPSDAVAAPGWLDLHRELPFAHRSRSPSSVAVS